MDRRYQTTSDNRRTRVYVEGNTVRKYEAAPKREPKGDPRREKEERKAQERKRQASRAAKANQERALQMSPGYVFFLSAAVVVTLCASVLFLKLQAQTSHHMRQIASLESQISDLKADNDATENQINASVNLEQVKDAAINQLGMVYPAQDQIVYFQVDEEDYMNQYQDIPE